TLDYKEDQKPHYVILSKVPNPAAAAEVESRADRLERHMRGFYYWWAVRGLALPMPKEKLVALVTANDDEFRHFKGKLAGSKPVVDGFHSPFVSVVVRANQPVSPHKDDPAAREDRYGLLADFARQFFEKDGMSRGAMLKGKPGQPTSNEELQAGIMALALK